MLFGSSAAICGAVVALAIFGRAAGSEIGAVHSSVVVDAEIEAELAAGGQLVDVVLAKVADAAFHQRQVARPAERLARGRQRVVADRKSVV